MWLSWFIFGLFVGAGVMYLVLWLHRRQTKVTWYEWLMGAIGLILVVLIVQNFSGSYAEMEPKAAWMGVLVMGIPAVILLGFAIGLPWRRQRRLAKA